MKRTLLAIISFIAITLNAQDQNPGQATEADSSTIALIMTEATERSQVMEILSYLTDVYGPRLTGSLDFMRAARWVEQKLASWGLSNVHLEGWGPFGHGWELKTYCANVTAPSVFPLLSYPKAWSPATGGSRKGEVIWFNANTDSAVATFRGKLKNTFVMMGDEREIKAHFDPEARRESDAGLLTLANTSGSRPRRRRPQRTEEFRERAMREYRKEEMLLNEGALGILTASRGDGGNIFVQQASVPSHPDTPWSNRPKPWAVDAPEILPQVVVAAEQYNRMIRMIKKGEKVRLEMNLDAAITKIDSGYNIIAELPSTDLRDEIVMVGAHFDSWHGGTGATDNATGSAVCMEAVRILKTLGLKPRRTVRIALWGGEEEGLLGSRAYVARHFGSKEEAASNPEAQKFSVYFNDDNGTGRFRGIYMQGNEAVRPIFRQWFDAIGDNTASTLSLANTGSTDHVSFDAVGLPAFQFIQDDIEYFTRTHHSTMDVYDRAQAEDLQQASAIMAIFAYNAAISDSMIPRKKM